MTKLAIMSDLHIDLNHFDDFEIQTLIDTLSAEKKFLICISLEIFLTIFMTSLTHF